MLLDQIPAVVFMAYLDQGIGEAYVSPQIEATLGFSQKEWLEDPVRWYRQIHPDDKTRWSDEAAEMFLSGSRCDRRIASWRATDGWFGFIARRGWSGATTASRGSFTAWGSTSPNSSRCRRRCRRSAMSSRRFSIPWARWSSCWTGKAESYASTAPASR